MQDQENWELAGTTTHAAVELSVIIPVYNGSQTIADVAKDLRATLADVRFEIILVNDGSSDASFIVCSNLVEQFPNQILLLELSRNFGEHNAVLAGLHHSNGQYVAILDDDGQNRAVDALRMFEHARKFQLDVVYAQYGTREHSLPRVIGSWINDKAATLILKKPRDLYLSSFKVMSRLVVDQIARYSGPLPYIDGLILRMTRNIGQLQVNHHPRQSGKSGYTLAKLISVWLNMCAGSSMVPLRLLGGAGFLATTIGLLMLIATGINRLCLNPQAAVVIPVVIGMSVLVIGVQLVALGVVGEFVGRTFLHQSGMPPYVVRSVRGAESPAPVHVGSRILDHARLPARTA